MLLMSFAFQVFAIVVLGPLVPGVHIGGLLDAVFAAVVFAIISSLLTWVLSIDSDDSYYSQLVRRLQSRRPDATHTKEPGLVIVQIDGLAHPVLTQQINAGRVPVISKWLREGKMHLAPWVALLPTQTSASQAGIMFGNNDDIPAFRWWDKERNVLFRLEPRHGRGAARSDGLEQPQPRPAGQGRREHRQSDQRWRRPFLPDDVHDARPHQGSRPAASSYLSFFLSPYGFVHAIVLGVAEMAKEVFQARRARLAEIEPRMERGFPYPFLRALTNVVLRHAQHEPCNRGDAARHVGHLRHLHRLRRDRPSQRTPASGGARRARRRGSRAAEPDPRQVDAPRPYRWWSSPITDRPLGPRSGSATAERWSS